MKRVIYLVIDQLAGHWEESVKIEGTDLPPANVKGYHERGLIPNFSYLIDNGLWVKRPWNKAECQTPCGMRYLATGSYIEEKACFIIVADHGYHLGCSEAAEAGIMTNNRCHGHGKPYDCEVWDFENNHSTGIYSGGPRRITFILSGGGLDKKYRGKTIEEAEIIDVIPTIAQLLDVPYKCQGKSIL